MIRLSVFRLGSRGRFRSLLALLLAALVTQSAATSLPAKAAQKAQPLLLQMAAQRPDATVSVIVQKMEKGSSVEQTVARLGGQVTMDLHIINAFAARLPARAAAELATDSGVRWVSLDAPVVKTGSSSGPISTTNLQNTYIKSIGADRVWNASPYIQGQGVGVAVVDSGVLPDQDLYTPMGVNRLTYSVKFNSGYNQTVYDGYGHGTHVAGIVAGNGAKSNGAYIGVAPYANVINVKVSDDAGAATASNVVNGLQWINDNKAAYNIKVVNLSLNSSVSESYNTNPIDAAVEILWFNKVVVVVSAGNNGRVGALYPPANDPFAITVGAVDDKGTAGISDDTIASFSSYGTTADGVTKPDLVAPGKDIVSLAGTSGMGLPVDHPGNVVSYNGSPSYFRMSGTSMAAPMVAGAAALLLQDEPNLTPDQVKYRLKATAVKDTRKWPGYTSQKAGSGYLDVYAAVRGSTTASANTGQRASQLLSTGGQPITWGSATWNSVNWNSVNWNSVNWNSVNWNSVNWNSDYWDQ